MQSVRILEKGTFLLWKLFLRILVYAGLGFLWKTFWGSGGVHKAFDTFVLSLLLGFRMWASVCTNPQLSTHRPSQLMPPLPNCDLFLWIFEARWVFNGSKIRHFSLCTSCKIWNIDLSTRWLANPDCVGNNLLPYIWRVHEYVIYYQNDFFLLLN